MTESAFIEFVARLTASLPRNGFEGIGDDCAVLPIGDGEALVFTADLLNEGVHFLRAAASPREVGRKAVAVNLSDVAAMGARPVATLLSLSLPANAVRSGWAEEFMRGYEELSRRYGVLLAGGDTTGSTGGITISVTAIGRAPLNCIKRRSAALPGDRILVSGPLGESGAGLQDILAGRYDTPLAQIHKNPLPQVEEGVWLGTRQEVHAMMDLSDGLASDLPRIAACSHVNAEIYTERIPAPAGLESALTGGEDYKLLFTADAACCEHLRADFVARFHAPLYEIGSIGEGEPEVRFLRNGIPLPFVGEGFRHF